MSTDVVGKLWGFCNTLRHDGIDYGDYIEQLTYLLFLKMADERDLDLPIYKELDELSGRVHEVPCDWKYLRKQSGVELGTHYARLLTELGQQKGILGDIFGGAQSRFTNPANMQRLIKLIDETEWTALEVDVKAAAFEGLLEKAAAEGKKGAGQYFTPRVLINSVVNCLKPDPRAAKDFKVCDPACGTGGFLVAAYEWLKELTGGAFDRSTARRIRTNTYFGQELVARPRRLALMNLYLHQVEPRIKLGDSIYETPGSDRFDVILTNPPFGTKGANQVPTRDFVVETSNKQLNFIQHIQAILKPGGRAGVVVPDNVLFAQKAAEVFEVLMEDCDVHTVLRCPRGAFTPYTKDTLTNVIFFTKGVPTSKTWVYDLRAGIPTITQKSRPLLEGHFTEFESCFGGDPLGRSPRRESDSSEGRWRSFDLAEIKKRDYKLQSFRWLRDDATDGPDEALDPEELVRHALESLHAACSDLERLQAALERDGSDL